MGNKQLKNLRQNEVEKIDRERERIRALSVRPPESSIEEPADDPPEPRPSLSGTESAEEERLQRLREEQLQRLKEERQRAAVLIQARVRGFLCRRYYLQVRRRTPIARELCTTEATYIDALQMLLNNYMKPLMADIRGEDKHRRSPFKENEVKTVFGCVEVLLNINSELFGQLRAATARMHHATCIGSIFLASVEYLRSYVQFVNNYNTSIDIVQQWRQHDACLAVLARLDEQASGAALEMCLITPIQRIPRYVLLLKDLLRRTPTAHPDFVDLTIACEKMEALATLVNRRKMESDRNRDVMRIQATIYPSLAISLIAAHRQLLLEGDCELVTPKTPFSLYISPQQSFARPLGQKVERIRFSSFTPSRIRDSKKLASKRSNTASRRDSSAIKEAAPYPPSPAAETVSSQWHATAMRFYLFNDLFLCCKPKSTGSFKPKLACSTSDCAAMAIEYASLTSPLARFYTKPIPTIFENMVDIFLLFPTMKLRDEFIHQVGLSSPSASTSTSTSTSSLPSAASISNSPSTPTPSSSSSPLPSTPTPTPHSPLPSTSYSPSASLPSLPISNQSAPLDTSNQPSPLHALPESSSPHHVDPQSNRGLIRSQSTPVSPMASTSETPLRPDALTPSEDYLMPSQDSVVISGVGREGYIQKKGHVRHNWKTRFLRLENDLVGPAALFYYEDDQASKPKGKILLIPPMEVSRTGHDTRKYCFSIFSNSDTNIPLLTISVASELDLEAWIDSIEDAIDSFDDD